MLGVDHHHYQEVQAPTPPMMDCLPTEIVANVLAHVAASSPVDLLRCKLSCKALHDLSKEKHVLQQVSLENLVARHSWLTDDAETFFLRCFESNNPDALLHYGMVQYFSKMMLEEGFKNLEKAAEQGNILAGYVISLIMVCSGEKEIIKKGAELMINIMRVIRGKGIVECRKKLRDWRRSMWLANKLVAETKPEISCAMQQQHEVQCPWSKVDYYDEDSEDSVVCDACKIVREINFFHELLCI